MMETITIQDVERTDTEENRYMEWEEIAGNWLLVPRHPIAIIHFLGGAFVSAAPQLTYRWLLEQLAKQGYAIIATPFDSAFNRHSFDHGAIARSTLLRLESALEYMQDRRLCDKELPIYGLGHSLGCKLHLLNNSLFDAERAGNILMAFNNYPAKRAIPFYDQVSQASSIFDSAVQGTRSFLEQYPPQRLFEKQMGKPTGKPLNDSPKTSFSSFFNRVSEQVSEQVTRAMPKEVTEMAQNLSKDVSQTVSQQLTQLTPDLDAEFIPSPDETQQLVAECYDIERNLLIQFKTDDIDQTTVLNQTLSHRFPEQTRFRRLSGTHLTPLGQDVNWAAGQEFSPIDAVGQFMKQGAYQDLHQLKSAVLEWLAHHQD